MRARSGHPEPAAAAIGGPGLALSPQLHRAGTVPSPSRTPRAYAGALGLLQWGEKTRCVKIVFVHKVVCSPQQRAKHKCNLLDSKIHQPKLLTAKDIHTKPLILLVGFISVSKVSQKIDFIPHLHNRK